MKETLHIYPINEKGETDHKTENGVMCWCNPKIEKYAYADLVIHNKVSA
jgi:hypothetical protein